jgi:hypothetical protein
VNAGDWIALGSAAVAIVGAGIAYTQARSARAAADAASRQAAAAEEQVAISRRQFEVDLAARNEAEGPTFAIEEAVDCMRHQRFITATLVLLSGPPLSVVKIRLAGPDARALVPSIMSREDEWAGEMTWEDVSPVARRPVVAEMEWNAGSPLHLTLDLECVEEGGNHRTWNRTYTATAQEEPPEPGPWKRRSL